MCCDNRHNASRPSLPLKLAFVLTPNVWATLSVQHVSISWPLTHVNQFFSSASTTALNFPPSPFTIPLSNIICFDLDTVFSLFLFTVNISKVSSKMKHQLMMTEDQLFFVILDVLIILIVIWNNHDSLGNKREIRPTGYQGWLTGERAITWNCDSNQSQMTLVIDDDLE